MKIALFTAGSFYGDVGPYLEIAKRMQLLGHETLLVIPEEFADKTYDFNCCYYMGDVLPPELEKNSTSYGEMIFGILNNLLRNAFDRIDEVLLACQDVDVILSHPLCAISDIVADYHGIRNIELLISSMYFNNNEKGRSEFLNNIGLDSLNRCRQKLGLSTCPYVSLDIEKNTNVKITLFPDFYVKTNQNVIYGNFIHYEDVDDISEELLNFIDNGPAPIIFAMGSGSKHMTSPKNFNEITVELAKKYRSILLGKSDIIHDNIFVCDFPVPHSKLFPLASLVVTHGGIGTIGKCMEYNIPQIAIPQMPENKVNADLMSHIITVIDPIDYTVNNMSRIIENYKYDYDLGKKYSDKINQIDVIDIIEKTINT